MIILIYEYIKISGLNFEREYFVKKLVQHFMTFNIYIYMSYITNYKKGVGFREIFQSEKWFRRRKSLKSTGLGHYFLQALHTVTNSTGQNIY
jgi:hypothetical protein